jgi:PBP1b-binding outer membrane lipoprotein LpoB
MKKKLLFILIFSLIFCAGCSARYTITIDEDGKVEERLYAKEDESFFDNYPNSSKGLVISYLIEPYKDDLANNGYNIETNINSTNGGVIVTKKYDSIEDYVKNSIIYKQFTDEIKIEKKNGKVTISTEGQFSHSEQNQELIPVDEATINIDVPFKVENNNANETDNDTLYSWNFKKDEKEKRTITITYNTKVIGNKQDFPILIVLGILGGLLLIGFIVYSRIIAGKSLANKI